MLNIRFSKSYLLDRQTSVSGMRKPYREMASVVFSSESRHPFFFEPGIWISIPRFDVSVRFKDELVSSDNISHSLERVIAECLSRIPEAMRVYFSKEGDAINIWTVLSAASRDVRKKVYEKEMQITQDLPEYVLNFRTTDPMGETIPQSAKYQRIDLEVIRFHADG